MVQDALKTTTWRDAFLASLITAIVAIPVASEVDRTRWTVGSDGVKYVQAAEHLVVGEGLTHTPHGPEPYEDRSVPLSLWPPGFPILIAGVAIATGDDASTVALWLGRIAWILMPMSIVWALRPLKLGVWAVPVAVLAALSPGALQVAHQVRADLIFLVMAATTLAVTSAILDRIISPRWMLMAGVLAGTAFAMRNAGITLLAVIPLILLVRAAAGSNEHDRLLSRSALFLFVAGAFLPIAAVLARSWMVFGQLQPYALPASLVTLNDNVRGLIFPMFYDLVGTTGPTWHPAYGWLLILFGAGCGAVLIAHHARRQLLTAPGPLLLLAYAAASAAIVVYGRTTYEWGELLNERHTLQYSWIVLGFAAAAASVWARRSRARIVSVGFVLSLLIAGRAFALEGILTPPPQGSTYLDLTRDHRFVAAVRGLAAADTLMLSDDGPFLTMTTDVDVRSLDPAVEPSRTSPFADELIEHRAAVEPRAVCFVSVGPPRIQHAVASDLPPGFAILKRGARALILCSLGTSG